MVELINYKPRVAIDIAPDSQDRDTAVLNTDFLQLLAWKSVADGTFRVPPQRLRFRKVG